jgi:hypothetical protein
LPTSPTSTLDTSTNVSSEMSPRAKMATYSSHTSEFGGRLLKIAWSFQEWKCNKL